jgi:peroxiredoxin
MNLFGETSGSTSQRLRRPSRGALTGIILAMVVSVTLNVLLAHKLRILTNAQSARIGEYLLKVDAAVPSIPAKRLSGQLEMISYQASNSPTVLYVLTPSCTWCARNMDNFKTLLGKSGEQYRFLALSLSDKDLSEYVAKNDLKVPVYSGLSPETLKAYKLGSTPQTIVISPEGKVLQDWVGAYVGDQQSQIESFFHVKLPGLKDLPKPEATKN